MDRKERDENLHQTLLTAMSGNQSDLWTTLPGIIESFDHNAETCEVQPTIQILFTSPIDGSKQWKTIPLCVDCPVIFPSGGGVTLSFPIAQGDECVIFFSSRCIDAWWQQGGVQPQAALRMHDLSDGFVLVGPRSQPRVHSPAISTTEVQLRTDDGQAFVAINPTSHLVRVVTSGAASVTATGEIDLTSEVKVKITAPAAQVDATTFTVNGNTVLNGSVSQGAGGSGGAVSLIGPATITNDLTAGGKSVEHHTHNVANVQGGSDTRATTQPL